MSLTPSQQEQLEDSSGLLQMKLELLEEKREEHSVITSEIEFIQAEIEILNSIVGNIQGNEPIEQF